MGEDHMSIGTMFAKSLLGKWATRLITNKLGRKVRVAIADLAVDHKQGDKVRVSGTISLEMSEGELEALIETIV